MIILLLLSLVVVYISVAKYIELRKINRPDGSLTIRIKGYLQIGRKDNTIAPCRKESTPEVHVIEKGLKCLGQPASEALPAIENVGSYEVGHLERGLLLLVMIAAGAPTIGFLSMVTDMVQAFFDLANAPGGINVPLLSSSTYQALVTTAGGLIIGIVTPFLYNYLVGQINRIVSRLKANTLDFMDVINEL